MKINKVIHCDSRFLNSLVADKYFPCNIAIPDITLLNDMLPERQYRSGASSCPPRLKTSRTRHLNLHSMNDSHIFFLQMEKFLYIRSLAALTN